METIVLVIHLLLAIALVGVVLVQRSEGGGLGIGGGTMGGLFTARASGNLLTRATAILAACFMATSITLAILSGAARQKDATPSLLIDKVTATQPQEKAPEAPASDRPAPAADAKPATETPVTAAPTAPASPAPAEPQKPAEPAKP